MTDALDQALTALAPLQQEKWVQGLCVLADKPDADRAQLATKLRHKLGEKRKQTKHHKHEALFAHALKVLDPPLTARQKLLRLIRAHNAKHARV